MAVFSIPMKRKLAAAVLFCLPTFAFADLKFESYVFEEKVLKEDGSVEFAFKFKNEGGLPVKIRDFETSCGCTVLKPGKYVYAAGEEGEIRGVYHIGGRNGMQKNTIRVLTDTPGQSEILLTLSVDISEAVRIKPRVVVWKLGAAPETKKAQITPHPGKRIELYDIAEKPENFTLKLEKTADGSYVLSATPDATDKARRAFIMLRGKYEGEKEFSYLVHLLIK